MEIPAEYRGGREHAYIKHTLLETYLYKLFMIVGQHQQTISYVDCLAGPWQEASEDLSDTSIGRSLVTMRKCLEGLRATNPNIRFRALFVEKDAKNYHRLKEYLDSLDTPVETESFHGEFYNVRHKILDTVGDISLLGHEIAGKITTYKSGHHVHNLLCRKLLATPTAYEIVSAASLEKETVEAFRLPRALQPSFH